MRKLLMSAAIPISLITMASPVYAGNYTLRIVSTAEQTSRYDHGTATIDSVQKTTIVRAVNVEISEKKSVTFVIGVLNSGHRPLVFGPENIIIRPFGTPAITLITYEQVMEAERRKQKREKFWAGLAALGRDLSAADADTTYGSGTYSGTASGFVGSDFVTAQTRGTFSYSEENPEAALAAQRQARAMNAEDRAELEARWAARTAANSSLLRITTVDPGAIYGGLASFPISQQIKRAKGPIKISIEVNVAGDKHVFFGQLSKAE